ncbi:MAG: response regulator [Chloroflexi bacterium]|nr:response regulator [Chloroflexota bacterium]
MVSKYVLIVDDEPANIELFEVMLRAFQVEVRGVTLGSEALAQARQVPPALVLLDLMLPDMSGFEVCAQLKAAPETAGVRVAMLTGRDDAAARQKAAEVGVDDFLVKPVSRGALKALLEATLKGN